VNVRVDTAPNWYINDYIRKAISPIYPTGFFGKYAGKQWNKQPYYFGTNGFEDEATNQQKYFKCQAYNTHPIDPKWLPITI